MWKQRIGMSVGNGYSVPTTEVVTMLKEIGFDAVSPEWEPGVDLRAIVCRARECGLAVQSLHAPYFHAAQLWSREESVYGPAVAEMRQAIEDCAALEIPVLVAHVWIGFDYTFDAARLCFEHFDELVALAREKGVKLAFENTEGDEYLFALMEHYREEGTVGFCWDSGHEMCYNHSQDLLARFGGRLLITHLNDNLGIRQYDGSTTYIDDLHLLPGDGIADWDDAVARLRGARRLEILNFELNLRSKPGRHENDRYAAMDLRQYFTEAYQRACRIAYRYAK